MQRHVNLEEKHICRARRLASDIYKNPEKGYYEEFATAAFSDALAELGLKVERNIARTGCISTVRFTEDGPRLAIIGELDAIRCSAHPMAGKDGYAHCCGHNLQVTAMYLLATQLVKWKEAGGLAGTVDIIGVPSEEFIDIAVKEDLQKKGEVTYFSGKQELTYKGYFDHTDIALMTHNMPPDNMGGKKVLVSGPATGFRAKKVEFIGREAHAGMHPEQGVNALQAMLLAMNNINALRDTFRDKDGVRVHYIVTNGGETVSVVPGYASLEMHIRSNDLGCLSDINCRIDKCLRAAALAIGCDLRITDMPGYFPGVVYDNISGLCESISRELVGEAQVGRGSLTGGASDYGDLTQFMTALKINTGGIIGNLHAKEFRLTDFAQAVQLPATVLGETLYTLLENGAAKAKEIIRENSHNLTVGEYPNTLEGASGVREYHYLSESV